MTPFPSPPPAANGSLRPGQCSSASKRPAERREALSVRALSRWSTFAALRQVPAPAGRRAIPCRASSPTSSPTGLPDTPPRSGHHSTTCCPSTVPDRPDPSGARAPATSDEEPCVVLSTAGDADTAARIGRALVEERLAACVQLVPGLRSLYRWQGRVADDPEVLLLIKSRTSLFDRLCRRVRELHPYETPELVALPAREESGYLAWLLGETETTLCEGPEDTTA
ncbi:MAG: hypothetical protein DWQ36_25185 [Acidobacteria bacterium]|nr:MAG: hypothetical protein DWQ30_11225 [Acidobacteriota bacterium]REJ99620.1 MAG: hypothetical protein DWQ36_25185 [Acidobacteriota bacterium]